MTATGFQHIVYGRVRPELAACISFLGLAATKGLPTTKIHFGTVHDADGFAAARVAKRENAHFTVCLVREGIEEGRGKAEDAVAIPGFWVDFDLAKHGISEEQALEILSHLEPTIIVRSSDRGWHCYWLFEQVWELSSKEENLRAQAASRAFAAKFDSVVAAVTGRPTDAKELDKVADLARVLRLPGSKNFNPDYPDSDVTVYDAEGPRYDRDVLLAWAGQVMSVASVSAARPMPSTPPSAAHRPIDVAGLRRNAQAQKYADLRRYLDGQPLPPDGRNSMLPPLTQTFVNLLPSPETVSVSDAVELLRPCIEATIAMNSQGDSHPPPSINDWWRLVDSALTKRVTEIAEFQPFKAQRDAYAALLAANQASKFSTPSAAGQGAGHAAASSVADGAGNYAARTLPPTIEQILLSEKFKTPRKTYPSGFPELDALIGGGIKSRQASVIAGPTGGGKTGLATTIATSLSRLVPVLFVATEIDEGEQAARFAGPELDLSADQVVSLRVDPSVVASRVHGWHVHVLFLDDPSVDGVNTIYKAALALRDHYGVAPAIIVDYLQQLSVDDADHKRLSVSAAVRSLRQLAQQLDVPVIATSSVSRSYYGRQRDEMVGEEDPRAWLAAGKESGDIEYSAAVFSYLDVAPEENADGTCDARLIVAKSRGGKPGFVGLTFTGRTGRFTPSSPPASSFGPAVHLRKDDAQMLALLTERAQSGRPLVKNDARRMAGMGVPRGDRAIERLLAAGEVVHKPEQRPDCAGKKRTVQVLVPRPNPPRSPTGAQSGPGASTGGTGRPPLVQQPAATSKADAPTVGPSRSQSGPQSAATPDADAPTVGPNRSQSVDVSEADSPPKGESASRLGPVGEGSKP